MDMSAIIRAAAAVHGVSPADITGPSRKGAITKARRTAAFLMDDAGENYTQIAKHLGRKHNTCASAMIDTVDTNMTPERQAQIDVARMAARLFSIEASTTRKGETA